ncbi:hypothetical protein HDU76_010192 [Blyttiomyces sp. JEL0837]|nr:hypothetical protein HDU76_010192 [Blyttiomyces sp. JEL0837]
MWFPYNRKDPKVIIRDGIPSDKQTATTSCKYIINITFTALEARKKPVTKEPVKATPPAAPPAARPEKVSEPERKPVERVDSFRRDVEVRRTYSDNEMDEDQVVRSNFRGHDSDRYYRDDYIQPPAYSYSYEQPPEFDMLRQSSIIQRFEDSLKDDFENDKELEAELDRQRELVVITE